MKLFLTLLFALTGCGDSSSSKSGDSAPDVSLSLVSYCNIYNGTCDVQAVGQIQQGFSADEWSLFVGVAQDDSVPFCGDLTEGFSLNHGVLVSLGQDYLLGTEYTFRACAFRVETQFVTSSDVVVHLTPE